MRNHEKPDYIVPASRLAWGRFNHERNREEGEGDIHASYSGDRICDSGVIRKPFKFEGALWVCTGSSNEAHSAFRIVPLEMFEGKPTTYSEKVHNNPLDRGEDGEDWQHIGEAARNDPIGFYHGMTVKQGGKNFVMVGPEKVFAAQTETQHEAETETETKEMPTLAPIVGEQISMFGA